MEITEGMRVQRVNFEHNGTPACMGTVTRIERDDEKVTYWVTWEGAPAPAPHGRSAFAPLPELPAGWTLIESMPTSQHSVSQILRCNDAWGTRYTDASGGVANMSFCANEADARESYAWLLDRD